MADRYRWPLNAASGLLGQLVGTGAGPLDGEGFCRVAAAATATSGAAIMLLHDGAVGGSIGAVDPVSMALEELQFTLGEGPCVDACRDGQPVLEPDLAAAGPQRWIAFAPQAIEIGALAVFGFPIAIGGVMLGALNLHRRRPGPLDDEQYADALVLADLAAELILLLQIDAPPGELAAGSRRGRTSITWSTRRRGWCPCSSESASIRRCCGCAPGRSAPACRSWSWPGGWSTGPSGSTRATTPERWARDRRGGSRSAA